MPRLNWMGKEAVRNHHHTVPFRLLRDVGERSVGDPGSGNLIVAGDNLIALKALAFQRTEISFVFQANPSRVRNDARFR